VHSGLWQDNRKTDGQGTKGGKHGIATGTAEVRKTSETGRYLQLYGVILSSLTSKYIETWEPFTLLYFPT
jgi:hypothetical protein